MFSRRLAVTAFFLSLPLAACGGATLSAGTGDPTDDAATPTHPTPASDSGVGGGSSCVKDSDCGAGQACGWTTSVDWCAADDTGQGTCVTLMSLACQLETLETGCDCSGNEVTWSGGCSGLPNGYAPRQLAHAGSCAGPTPVPTPTPSQDAGSAPVACATSTDCTTGQFCGYPLGGCGSAAQCLPEEETGFCNSIGIYCACDGTNVALSGCAEAATVPVAHVGACAGTDGGF